MQALDAVLDVLRLHLASVVEEHTLFQVKCDRFEVIRHLPALRQTRLIVPVLVHDEQRLKYIGSNEKCRYG